MNWSAVDSIIALVSLILGGSGVAAINAFIVRPRVYCASRDYKAVRVFSEREAAQIELTLRNQGVALGLVEIEWWNAGYRAAERLVVELKCPATIKRWRMTPDASDVAAGWTCDADPLTDDHSRDTLVIRQTHLMPRGKCSLLVAYDLTPGDRPETRIQAFVDKQAIQTSQAATQWVAAAAGLVAIAVMLGLVLTAGWLASGIWGPESGVISISVIVAGLLSALLMRMIVPTLVGALGPGAPSWTLRDRDRA